MEAIEGKKVIYTGQIPQCPYCEKPTERSGGMGHTTCVYYPPIYNKYGNNINPDRNMTTSYWECLECKKQYTISGNTVEGFYYK